METSKMIRFLDVRKQVEEFLNSFGKINWYRFLTIETPYGECISDGSLFDGVPFSIQVQGKNGKMNAALPSRCYDVDDVYVYVEQERLVFVYLCYEFFAAIRTGDEDIYTSKD